MGYVAQSIKDSFVCHNGGSLYGSIVPWLAVVQHDCDYREWGDGLCQSALSICTHHSVWRP